MARNTTKGSIDLTDYPGETHLSEIDMSESVSGTSPDELGDETTDVWPSNLPRDEFTDMQAEIIQRLVTMPEAKNGTIAESVGCSWDSVYNTRHKLSAMGHNDDVPFDIPDDPVESVGSVQPYLDDVDTKREPESEDMDTNTTESHQGAGKPSLDATAETVDVTACACAVPEFATDTAAVGPFSIQVLYCGSCDHEFTTLREATDAD